MIIRSLTHQAPPALYQGAVAAGTKKAQNSFGNIFKLGIVAGAHIAFGAFLAISVGGACPGIASSNPGLQKVRYTWVVGSFLGDDGHVL